VSTEKQSGLGSTPELDGIFPIHKQCGKPGRERASIGSSVSFRVRPESGFQECFRTSGRINHRSGGLLAIAQTEDERITGAGLVRFHIPLDETAPSRNVAE
jgi:hypothetical protein